LVRKEVNVVTQRDERKISRGPPAARSDNGFLPNQENQKKLEELLQQQLTMDSTQDSQRKISRGPPTGRSAKGFLPDQENQWDLTCDGNNQPARNQMTIKTKPCQSDDAV
jgi:hypothetical protein